MQPQGTRVMLHIFDFNGTSGRGKFVCIAHSGHEASVQQQHFIGCHYKGKLQKEKKHGLSLSHILLFSVKICIHDHKRNEQPHKNLGARSCLP